MSTIQPLHASLLSAVTRDEVYLQSNGRPLESSKHGRLWEGHSGSRRIERTSWDHLYKRSSGLGSSCGGVGGYKWETCDTLWRQNCQDQLIGQIRGLS